MDSQQFKTILAASHEPEPDLYHQFAAAARGVEMFLPEIDVWDYEHGKKYTRAAIFTSDGK